MSRTLSFRDLMVCEELAHIKNEVSLLHPSNDKLVSSILDKIGFDTEYPVTYVPSKHRCMQNKVAVGYMVVGEISINRKFINSGMCSLTERMVAASYTDRSLAQELGTLTGNYIDYRTIMNDDAEEGPDELPDDMLEPDRVEVGQQIKMLVELRDAIRGSIYNEAGDLKTFEEYAA
jgi:hypothetical protein